MTKAVRIPGLLVLMGLAFIMSGTGLGAGDSLHRVWAIQNAKVLISPLHPPVEKTTIIIRDGRLGSLEPGKDADFFLTTGDPLDIRSEVKFIFINGRKIDMSNWWEDLYKKWKSRPTK